MLAKRKRRGDILGQKEEEEIKPATTNKEGEETFFNRRKQTCRIYGKGKKSQKTKWKT